MLKKTTSLALSASFMFGLVTNGLSCTRVVDAVANHPVMVGRNMDWYGEMPSTLIMYPRGIEKVGSPDDVNPIKWKSKYASLVTASYNVFAADGLNEKGLGAHMLWQEVADYGVRDKSKPGLIVHLWEQFYLDNFASVDEAVKFTEKNQFQILPFFLEDKQRWVKLHLAIEDATGDSAIIEYIDGKANIYHDKSYTVLTNDPVYSDQLRNLALYAGFGGDKPLPGTNDAKDRFVRASFYQKNLPEPSDYRTQVAEVFSVVHNAAAPYMTKVVNGMPYTGKTLWSTVSDLTNKRYYFAFVDSMGTIWVDMNKLNVGEGAPIMKLKLDSREDLTGDVTKRFVA